MDLKNLRVNGNRLKNTLEEMAKIGATPGGGVQRLTLTDEDKQARGLFVSWLKELNRLPVPLRSLLVMRRNFSDQLPQWISLRVYGLKASRLTGGRYSLMNRSKRSVFIQYP